MPRAASARVRFRAVAGRFALTASIAAIAASAAVAQDLPATQTDRPPNTVQTPTATPAAPASTTVPATDAPARDVDASGSVGIDEVIVTAQKREQRLQDVPIAITAVTEETLQVNRVQSIMDLTGLAPGLLARTNAGSLGSPSFSMRGVFASASQPSSDRQISTYIDGVYIGSTRGSVFDLADIQRIEVLRGPQGTLFGRNATAGAVSVITRNPTGEFGIRQEITVGNYDQLRTRTSVDLPAFGPFSAYATYVHDERKGDIRNLGAGTVFDRTSPFTNIGATRSPKRLGDRNFENFFAALRFQPTDTLDMTYKFDRSDGENTPEGRGTTAINRNSLIGNLLLGVIAAQPAGGGRFGPVPLFPDHKRPKALNNAWSQPGYLKVSGHNLTTQFQVSDSVSLRNVTAYRRNSVYGPSTIAGLSGLEFTAGAVAPYAQFAAISQLGARFFQLTPAQQGAVIGQIATALTPAVGSYFSAYEGNSYGKASQFSTETQLNYDSDLLTLTVGGLYYRSKELSSGLPGMAANFAFAPTPQLLPLGNVQESTSRTRSYAAYTQGEIHVTPQIDVVLGGRYTKDKKLTNLVAGGIFTGTRTGDGQIINTTSFPGSFKKSKPTYSVGVNYKPTDDILLYGKYSTAFLSGGAVGALTFAPETVKSVEAGVKADLFDRRLRVNVALWDANYEHSQSSQSGQNVGQPQLGVVVIDNGPLRAQGFELEVTTAPVRGVSVGGSIGYTDAKLTAPNPVASQGRPYALTGIPKWVGQVNAQYETQPIFNETTLFFRADAQYTSKYRGAPFKDLATVTPVFAPYRFVASRWIVNGRIALRDFKIGPVKAEIAAWGRNLFDNRDANYPLLFGDFQLGTSYQQARTYGADLILRF